MELGVTLVLVEQEVLAVAVDIAQLQVGLELLVKVVMAAMV